MNIFKSYILFFLTYILQTFAGPVIIFSQNYTSQQKAITESIDTSGFETVPAEQGYDSNIQSTQGNRKLSRVYLEMGHGFLRKKEFSKAREYYERSSNEADGEASQKARLALINLRASLGEDNLISEIENFNATDKPEAYFMMADGWESYYLDNPSQVKFLELSRENYILLALRYANSTWGQKTKLKLASLYIKEKEYGFALDHLLPLLEKSQNLKKKNQTNREKQELLGLDMAWFLLGRTLEESNQHKDYDRAIKSYTNVLNYPQSPFLEASKTRIRYIKRLFLNK